jgi:hypothetical protein
MFAHLYSPKSELAESAATLNALGVAPAPQHWKGKGVSFSEWTSLTKVLRRTQRDERLKRPLRNSGAAVDFKKIK